MLSEQTKNSSHFVEWIRNNINCSVGDVLPKGLKMALALAVSSTVIEEMPKRVAEYFTAMFRCKLFRRGYFRQHKCSICDVPTIGLKIAVTFVGNSASIQEMFKRVADCASGTTCFQRSGYTAVSGCVGKGAMDYD